MRLPVELEREMLSVGMDILFIRERPRVARKLFKDIKKEVAKQLEANKQKD